MEVPFVFNTESIVAAWPRVLDEDVPIEMRRYTNISLKDGQQYSIKFKYDEVCS